MAFVIIALGALFIISAYRITVAYSLSRVTRSVLLALRLFLFALIMTAFIEPVFVFEQLSSPLRPVSVLVDVSKSMQAFIPDSTVFHAISAFEKWNAVHAGEKNIFVFSASTIDK